MVAPLVAAAFMPAITEQTMSMLNGAGGAGGASPSGGGGGGGGDMIGGAMKGVTGMFGKATGILKKGLGGLGGLGKKKKKKKKLPNAGGMPRTDKPIMNMAPSARSVAVAPPGKSPADILKAANQKIDMSRGPTVDTAAKLAEKKAAQDTIKNDPTGALQNMQRMLQGAQGANAMAPDALRFG